MFIVPISSLPTLFPETGSVPQAGGTFQAPFSQVLSDAIQNMAQTQEVSGEGSMGLALGKVDDLHNIQIDSAKASIAVDFAVGLTSRALSAYNEIIRMQI